jgi:hypothetical protein
MPKLRHGLVLALVALLASCGSADNREDSDEADAPAVAGDGRVEADDGSAVLTFPSSALPDGVSASSIHVNRITASDLGTSEADLDGAHIYVLEPDGLQLGPGAVLSTTIGSPGGFLPQVFHLSGGEMTVTGSDDPFGLTAETADGVAYLYDEEAGTTTVDVPVEHFSSIIVTSSSGYAYFQLTATRGEAVIGQRPPASGVVSLNTTTLDSGNYLGITSFDVHYSDQTWGPRWFYTPLDFTTHRSENEGQKGTLSLRFALIESSVILRGKTQPGFGTTVLDPKTPVFDRPPRTAFNNQFTIPNSDFICETAGDGHLDFEFSLEWTEEVELQRAWDPTWRRISDRSRYVDVTIHSRVKCLASAPTTTLSKTTGSGPAEEETEIGQVRSAQSAVGVTSATGLIAPDGGIWWVLILGEGWSPAQFQTFFSMYFAVNFSGPPGSGAFAACQTHAGVVGSSGSGTGGQITPRAFFRRDGAVVLESGVNVADLPEVDAGVTADVESGVWEDEAGDPAVFSTGSFALSVKDFPMGDPLTDSSLTPACP